MARVRLAALLTALGLAIASNALADETERAEELFRAGNQAFAAGDYQAAFTHYREAWTLRKSFEIACNLGRTEAELGLARDAAEHLDACLRTFSVSSRSEVKDARNRFRELFNRVRAKVGAVEVLVRPSGAEVTIDGVRFGVAPFDGPLFVEPGQRRVRAKLAGYEEREITILADAGGSSTLDIELIAAQEPAAGVAAVAVPAPRETPPPSPPPRAEPAPVSGRIEPRTIVVISGAALTLVGLGVGVGFLIDANAANQNVAELAAGSEDCSGSNGSSKCAELRAEMDREDRSRDAAGALFLGSALASAATLGLWLVLPEFASRPPAGLHVAPRISRSGDLGLTVSGHY